MLEIEGLAELRAGREMKPNDERMGRIEKI